MLWLPLLHHPRRTVALRPPRRDGRRSCPPLQRPLHRRLLRGRSRRERPCRRHPHPSSEKGSPHAAPLTEAGLSRCRDRRPLRTGGRPQGLPLLPRQHPPSPNQTARLLIPYYIYVHARAYKDQRFIYLKRCFFIRGCKSFVYSIFIMKSKPDSNLFETQKNE